MQTKLAQINWYHSVSPAEYKDVSCVYFIHLLDPRRPSRRLKIPRLAGTDLDGILEIGQTKNLASKIWHFKGSFMGTSSNDTEGWTFGHYHKHSKWLKDLYGSKENLLNYVEFTFIKTPLNWLRDHECKAIDNYCSRFGEPPVLNGQVPGVMKKQDKDRRELIAGPSPHGLADTGSIRLGTVVLTDRPPNPLTGLPCNYTIQLMCLNDPTKLYPIHRIARTDPEGILVKGKTISLARRIWQIRCDLLGRHTHGEWGLFHHVYDICTQLRKDHGPWKKIINYLVLTYVRTEPSLLLKRESQQIDDYIKLYGEAPPFNSQIPGNKKCFR